MDPSIAQAPGRPGYLELPAWKLILATVSAILLSIIMLVAGIWKCSDPVAAAERLHQALVPAWLALPAALMLGIAETFAGVLVLVSRYRRWGAWISIALLVAFLVYIGVNYGALRGEECNCFPWIERTVGPAFFLGDAVMLVLAVVAARWSSPSEGWRGAVLILGAVVVFAGASLGMRLVEQSTVMAPESIVVNGQVTSLRDGRVFLYFFDPECTHCLFAAQDLAGLNWDEGVQLIGVPTERAHLAEMFLEAAGWRIPLSPDVGKLRAVFSFGDPPFAVALENGRAVLQLRVFEHGRPAEQLRKLGFVR